jgi:hypothetical protein
MFAHRLSRTVAVALALGAVAAPAASAAPIDPVTTSQSTLPQDFKAADVRDAVVARGLYEPMRPQDQPQPPQDLRNPDTVDFANGRGTYNSPEVVVVDVPKPESAPVSAGGIDWADAGLGAGSLLAISLIGLGGALFMVHRRSTHRVAVWTASPGRHGKLSRGGRLLVPALDAVDQSGAQVTRRPVSRWSGGR